MLNRRKITITADDFERLRALVASKIVRVVSAPDHLDDLQVELNQAHIVSDRSMAEDVVTMDSIVMLRDLDTNETETYTLVYPDRADIANHQLSVLAPIGAAILGCRVGDELRRHVPERWRRLRVEQVLHQPEREETQPVRRMTHNAR